MPFDLKVNRDNDAALYQQIVEDVKARISDGRLPPGTQLPTVRRLASDLGVTRLTVQHAYGELQADGWIEATVGRGTFVSDSVSDIKRQKAFGRGMVAPLTPDGVINDILQINQMVGLRSMASASPDARLFPADEFWAVLNDLKHDFAASVTYSSSQGDPHLRVAISRDLTERGIDTTPDDILVVAGVTQGLALAGQTLAQPGDRVLVEQPTYVGLLHTLKVYGLEPIGIEMDEDGPLLEEMERAIVQHRPRFFYTVPTFQNPTGHCMTLSRRKALLDLAADHGLLIVEDDIYGRLAFDEPPPPALKALDTRDLVVHVGSYSKVLMPGMRLGYLIAPQRRRDRLLSLRRANDLGSPTILQQALGAFLHDGGLRRHLRRVIPIYRERRDAIVSALQRHLPQTVRWHTPRGGFCCWLTMPSYRPFANLEQAALDEGWAVTPGEVFLAESDNQKSIRLCYGTLTPEVIQSGVETVAGLIRTRLAEPDDHQQQNDWAPLV